MGTKDYPGCGFVSRHYCGAAGDRNGRRVGRLLRGWLVGLAGGWKVGPKNEKGDVISK